MKVLAINSSPHKDKGNTALILTPFLEGMKEAGAEVELYYTLDLMINPCMGDHACQFKTPGKCIHSDDMQWLLPKVSQADVWVWATPLYGSGMTGTMKMFMDRLLPLADASIEVRGGRLRHPSAAGRKKSKAVLVSTCGLPEIESFDPLIAHIKEKCANSDSEFAGALLRPAGPAMASMLKNGAPITDIFNAARDAGLQLAHDGKISGETLGIVSRPIISKEAMMQIVNQIAMKPVKNSVSTEDSQK
jgi:multimeric flavodoxin WrbA